MEYGMVPKLDQFAESKALESKRVQASSQSSEVKDRQNLENIQKEAELISKKSAEASKTRNENSSSEKFEVLLTNTNFGFNNASRDFYVKVQRGEAENQYPTESMMRTKAYVLSLQNDINTNV